MLLTRMLAWFVSLNGLWQAIIVAGGVATALAALNKYAMRPFYLRVLRPGVLGIIAAFRAAPQAVELIQSGLDRLDHLTELVSHAEEIGEHNAVAIRALSGRVDELSLRVRDSATAAGSAASAAGTAATHAAAVAQEVKDAVAALPGAVSDAISGSSPPDKS